MIRSDHEVSLHDAIQVKITDVIKLLRAAAAQHPTEEWKSVCHRVGEETGVYVTFVRGLCDWALALPEANPHGNTHISTVLRDWYIRVTDVERWTIGFWVADWLRAAEATSTDEPSGRDGEPIDRTESQTSVADRAMVGEPVASPESRDPSTASSASDSSFARAGGVPQSPPLYNEAMLIREFDRRERERGPIFAGFIVNDLLPRFGFGPSDGKRILRGMEMHDIVRTEKKPNPKNPDRPTTFVLLNRAHPTVRLVLEGSSESGTTYPVATVDGEALSELIIRERR
jgi:hypothetical protein